MPHLSDVLVEFALALADFTAAAEAPREVMASAVLGHCKGLQHLDTCYMTESVRELTWSPPSEDKPFPMIAAQAQAEVTRSRSRAWPRQGHFGTYLILEF